MTWTRDQIAARAARDLRDGEYVNLGIGLPTLVANHLPEEVEIIVHSENGALGVGSYPTAEELDPDLVNAGKEPVTLRPGAACFDSALSFAIIRGGHIDTAILGAMQVSACGDLANWTAPGRVVKGMGGAMDLVAGARRVLVLMTHLDNLGNPKLLDSCTFPVTGKRVVNRIITDRAIFDVHRDRFILRELAPGITLQHIEATTGADFDVALETAPAAVPRQSRD